jgi:hypothetical protein
MKYLKQCFSNFDYSPYSLSNTTIILLNKAMMAYANFFFLLIYLIFEYVSQLDGFVDLCLFQSILTGLIMHL